MQLPPSRRPPSAPRRPPSTLPLPPPLPHPPPIPPLESHHRPKPRVTGNLNSTTMWVHFITPPVFASVSLAWPSGVRHLQVLRRAGNGSGASPPALSTPPFCSVFRGESEKQRPGKKTCLQTRGNNVKKQYNESPTRTCLKLRHVPTRKASGRRKSSCDSGQSSAHCCRTTRNHGPSPPPTCRAGAETDAAPPARPACTPGSPI
jgi:hypothetical protein